MDTGLAFRRFWSESFGDGREGCGGVIDKNADAPSTRDGGGFGGGDQDEGSLGVADLIDVSRVGEEGEVAAGRLVQRSEALD